VGREVGVVFGDFIGVLGRGVGVLLTVDERPSRKAGEAKELGRAGKLGD
jgi:hypothetical protein